MNTIIRTFLLGLLCWWSCGLTCAPALEEGDSEEETTGFRVRLAGIEVSRQVRFPAGEDGPQTSDRCRLTLEFLPAPTGFRSIDGLELSRIVTDAGEELEIDPAFTHRLPQFVQRWTTATRRRLARASGQGDGETADPPAVQLHLPVQSPHRPFQGFAQITGTLRLTVGQGPRRRVVMDPLAEWFEQNVQVRGLDQARFVLKRKGEDRLEIYLSNALAPRFEDFRIFDAEGARLRAHRRELTREPGAARAVYAVAVPEGARAEMGYYEDLETREVSFSFAEVPLPGPEIREEPDAVLDPEPVAE